MKRALCQFVALLTNRITKILTALLAIKLHWDPIKLGAGAGLGDF